MEDEIPKDMAQFLQFHLPLGLAAVAASLDSRHLVFFMERFFCIYPFFSMDG